MAHAKEIRRIGLLVIMILAIGAAAIFLLNNSNDTSVDTEEDITVANQKRQEISGLIEQWRLETQSMKSSSNPYDYTNTPTFQQLASLGPDYLPYLIEPVEQDGSLTSFVMAVAVIQVSKAKEAAKFQFENARGFVAQWKDYERSVPERYKRIKEQNKDASAAIQEIADLGVPVIPLIIEDIETSDDARYAPALAQLVQNEETPQDNDLKSWKQWSKDKGGKFKALKLKPDKK